MIYLTTIFAFIINIANSANWTNFCIDPHKLKDLSDYDLSIALTSGNKEVNSLLVSKINETVNVPLIITDSGIVISMNENNVKLIDCKTVDTNYRLFTDTDYNFDYINGVTITSEPCFETHKILSYKVIKSHRIDDLTIFININKAKNKYIELEDMIELSKRSP